jgi:3',5'-cyclic AMP phosphodiesterase CpdA
VARGARALLVAVGDHELGDDPWPLDGLRAEHFTHFKSAFARNMIDPLGLPAAFNGVPTRPAPGLANLVSFAYRIENVLFVSVDLFDFRSASTPLDPVNGAVALRLGDRHLAWLSDLLAAAETDSTIDHVIVQGHAPVLDPARMRLTSGLMVRDRQDSGLWQVLRQHDTRHGGKVRLYLAGEVHMSTVVRDPSSDIVQIIHGRHPAIDSGMAIGAFDVFTVHPDRIEWTVVVETTGPHDLVFRYALGRGERALAISVDGEVVIPLLNFPRTGPWGDWSVWAELETTVELTAGVRTIRALSTGRNGPNTDHLRLVAR